MTRLITARFPGKCTGCNGAIAPGQTIRHEGRGLAYHPECDSTGAQPGPARSFGSRSNYRRNYSRPRGRCEDAPCCGCCGPQGDGDYYGNGGF